MNIPWEAIAIGSAVFAALLMVWAIGKKTNPAEQEQPRVPPTFTGNVDAPAQTIETFDGDKSNIPPGAFEAEVRMLIDYGNKAAAIRVVREKMGLDLKDARDLVDKMEHGAPIPVADSVPVSDHANEGDRDVRELAHSGRLIEAIKLVRERKGLDLKQAKAYVERL